MALNSISPPIRTHFAKRLKSFRIPRGYTTARSFAVALEIDENRYTRYERAEVEPDLTLLMRMCTLLGVTPNDLLDADGGAGSGPGFAKAPGVGHNGGQRTSADAGLQHALAWELAEEIAKLDDPQETTALGKVARVSKTFGEIILDPFSFISRMMIDRRLDTLDAVTAGRIGQLAEALIEVAKNEILRSRRGQDLAPPPRGIRDL
jgi:transcriptional regulator with XRE-family HTH domain